MTLDYRKTLKHRRFTGAFMIAALVLNVLMSSVLANAGNESQYGWLCTSQGLVKVALNSTDIDVTSTTSSNHCPACTLFDNSVTLFEPDRYDQQPDQPLIATYLQPVSSRTPNVILSSRQLRAPPHSLI